MSAYSPGPPVAAQGGSADGGPLIPPPSEKAPARVVVTMILARFGVMAALATPDRKSTRLNSSHTAESRMPSSA